MTVRLALAALAAVASVPLAMPAAAQTSNDKVLMIFGNDKCPAGTICVRGREDERYRIPKTIRDTTPSTTGNSQRALAASTASVSASGIGSCGNVGPGGYTGCTRQAIGNSFAARKADAEAAPAAPER